MLTDVAINVLSLKFVLRSERRSTVFAAISRRFIKHLLHYRPILTTRLTPDNQQFNTSVHILPSTCYCSVEVTLSVVSVCLSVLFSERIDLQTSTLIFKYIFRVSRSVHISRSLVKIRQAKKHVWCPVWALSFVCLDLQTLYWYTLIISSSRSH